MQVIVHFAYNMQYGFWETAYSWRTYTLAALLLGRPLEVSSEVSETAEMSCCGGVCGTISFLLLLAGVFAFGPCFFWVSSVLSGFS